MTKSPFESPEDLAGRVCLDPDFAGRYKLIEHRGTGGTAWVFEAKDLETQRPVALKFLIHPDRKDLRSRFEQEARLLGRLSHPAIIQVLSHGEAQGIPYMAMPLVEGPSLREVMADEGPMDPGRAIGLMVQILDALDEAHQNGIIHRDLKPENILLEGKTQPRLLDLGVAKSYSEPGDLGPEDDAIVGTPAYMAPEQCRSESPSIHSDLYSAAIILFELLAGRPPFGGKTVEDVMKAQKESQVPRISQIHAALDPQWDEVFGRALAKAPSDRYPDGSSLKRVIQEAVAGRFLVTRHRGSDLAPSNWLTGGGSLSSRLVGTAVLACFPLISAFAVLTDRAGLAACAMMPLYSLFLTEVPSRFKLLEARYEVQVAGVCAAALSMAFLPLLTPDFAVLELWIILFLLDTVVFGRYQGIHPENRDAQQRDRTLHLMLLAGFAFGALLLWDLFAVGLAVVAGCLTLRSLFMDPIDSLDLSLPAATTVILLGARTSEGTKTVSGRRGDAPSLDRTIS